jgi:hypothetical protein
MNKIYCATIALSLLAGATAIAQPATLKVKQGDRFSYDVGFTMQMTQSMGGQDMTIEATSTADGLLAAGKAAKGRIDWAYDLKNMHMKLNSAMLPGGGKDTTIQVPTQKFTTDASGKILSIGKLEGKDQMMEMMSSITGKRQLKQWFSPEILKNHKSGDSWEEKTVDTIRYEGMGMEMLSNANTKYVFESLIDTLGMKAARVRIETTSMAIEGTMAMAGMDMAIDGDGATSGILYYAVKDGLLLANNSETQMNMRNSVSGQGDMVIPMTQKIITSVARK